MSAEFTKQRFPVRALACSCAVLLWGLCAFAVEPLTGITASHETISSTNDDYSTTGAGSSSFPSSSTYNVRFNVGVDNNLHIHSVAASGDTYTFAQLASQINLGRVDNPNVGGEYHILLYEEDNVSGEDIDLKPSFEATMEAALRSDIINRGADNVFCNTDNGDGNNNNIERIDYIFSDGYPAVDNLALRGFVVMDRGGNDAFQIAAILGLDSNGLPSDFSSSVGVAQDDWGATGYSIDTMVLRGHAGEDKKPSADVASQNLCGVFVSWEELGIQTNDFVYGYSIVANDVTSTNWTDLETGFPTNTMESPSYGGLDLMSGGGMYFGQDIGGVLGDLVWQDSNSNGVQNVGEPGLSNILITVYDSQTNVNAVTRSGSDGSYQIVGLPAGDYFVEFSIPITFSFSPMDAGTNDAVDSDVITNTGRTAVFSFNGMTNMTIDAGIFPRYDTDGDGMPDNWEDAYGLNKTNASDAILDGDADGVVNFREFVAGTVPTNSLSYMRILGMETVSGDDIRLNLWLGSNRTFRILSSANADVSKSQAGTVVSGSTDGTNYWTDTGAVSESSHRYYSVSVSHDEWTYTNTEEWAMHVQEREGNHKYLVAVPVNLGSENRLDASLGRQIAGGLSDGAGVMDNADCIQYMTESGAWKEVVLATNDDGSVYWWDPDLTATSAAEFVAGTGFWIERKSSPVCLRDNCVFLGRSFTNMPSVNMKTNYGGWNVFGWSNARSLSHENTESQEKYSTSSNQLGLAWIGVGGITTDPTRPGEWGDQIWVWEDNEWKGYYWLMDHIGPKWDGKWWDNRTRDFADFSFEPGVGYYYFHPANWGGSNFVWHVPSP